MWEKRAVWALQMACQHEWRALAYNLMGGGVGCVWQMHLRENNIDCLRCLISTWIKETTGFSLYWLHHEYLGLKKPRCSEKAAWTTSPVPLWSDRGGTWALIVAVAAEEEQRDFWAVTQSAGGALPPSDTDLLDNFTAVSSVMGQDKLPAPQWLSRLLGRTGLSRTGTVCFIAFVQCVFLLEVPVLSCLSAIIIF